MFAIYSFLQETALHVIVLEHLNYKLSKKSKTKLKKKTLKTKIQRNVLTT